MLDFFSPALYYSIFLGLLIILVLTKIIEINNTGTIQRKGNNIELFKTIIVALIFIIFFGLRDPYDLKGYFADTSGYTNYYESVKNSMLPSFFDDLQLNNVDFSSEFVFRFLRDFFAINHFDVSCWYLIVALIYIGCGTWAICKFFPGNEYLAFLFWITSFCFYSGGINGIRNADATSLCILGISFLLCNKNLIVPIILFLLSYYTHHSAGILILAFLLSYYFIRNTKIAIIIWILAIILSLLLGNQIANYALLLELDDRAEKYLINGSDTDLMLKAFSHIGFRWDFLLYSALPIIQGWYFIYKLKFRSVKYQVLLNTYILANSVWIIFMYAAFTNRFAMLSWSIIGFVIGYPIIKCKFLRHRLFWISSFLFGQIILYFIF